MKDSVLDIKRKDCTLLGIDTDRSYYEGCPTCDYGSSYVNYITYEFSVGEIKLRLAEMYDYPISEGELMMFWLNNIDKVKQMTFDEICAFLKHYHGQNYSLDENNYKVEKYEC